MMMMLLLLYWCFPLYGYKNEWNVISHYSFSNYCLKSIPINDLKQQHFLLTISSSLPFLSQIPPLFKILCCLFESFSLNAFSLKSDLQLEFIKVKCISVIATRKTATL